MNTMNKSKKYIREYNIQWTYDQANQHISSYIYWDIIKQVMDPVWVINSEQVLDNIKDENYWQETETTGT